MYSTVAGVYSCKEYNNNYYVGRRRSLVVCVRRKSNKLVWVKVKRRSKNDAASRISLRLNGELMDEVPCFMYQGSPMEKIGQVKTKLKCRVNK